MKAILLLGFISLSINLFGQNASYYWYKGEKVPLLMAKQKKFILFEKEDEDQVISDFASNSWEVIQRKEVNLTNALIPYNGTTGSESKKWAVIVGESDQISDSTALQLSSNVLYVSSFFSSLSGDEAGLSHLFYVRLHKDEDIVKLEDMASKNNVEILGKDKFMPLWYTLACTRYSKGNALEMANSFYESGIFKAAEPDLMPVNLIDCVDDDYFSDQWNLNNTGQYGGTSGVDINICDAWELSSGCDDIVIAFIDHGIEMDHDDLPNMFALSYDAETGTTPSDVWGPHGSARMLHPLHLIHQGYFMWQSCILRGKIWLQFWLFGRETLTLQYLTSMRASLFSRLTLLSVLILTLYVPAMGCEDKYSYNFLS